MKSCAIAACAAGTMLVATSPSASAGGWQPSSGSITIDAVNPCTGESVDFTVDWIRARTTATRTGTVGTASTGSYTATDGSTGTVRTTFTTSPTKDGYTDSYRQVLIGEYDGRAQRITFVFRVVVGADTDVKVDRTSGSCGG